MRKPFPEDGATHTEQRRQFARECADPDWSLSVPEPAKAVIRDLLSALEAVEAIHQPSACYDSCSYPHDCQACLVEWPCPTALAIGGGDR